MGTSHLSRKQRIIFKEFWDANIKIWKKKGTKKKDIVAIWKDGFVTGKHSHKWERKVKYAK